MSDDAVFDPLLNPEPIPSTVAPISTKKIIVQQQAEKKPSTPNAQHASPTTTQKVATPTTVPTTTTSSPIVQQPQSAKKKGLFDDDDDDLFANSSKPQDIFAHVKTKTSTTSAQQQEAALASTTSAKELEFADELEKLTNSMESSDLFAKDKSVQQEQQETSTTRKSVFAAVQQFSSKDLFAEEGQPKATSMDEDDDLFSMVDTKKKTTSNVQNIDIDEYIARSKLKNSSLFD